jgi:hypothetical protein
MLDEAYQSGDLVVSDTGTITYYDAEKMEDVTVKFDYSSNMSKNLAFWKEFSFKLKNIPECVLSRRKLRRLG